MATELSPEPCQIEHSASQLDSQMSAAIADGFLSPLGDSQETNIVSKGHSADELEPDLSALIEGSPIQGVASSWPRGNGSHGIDGTNQTSQPTQGPFFSRPRCESPLDFEHGFQYSKAPTPHMLLAPTTVPRNGRDVQDDSKDTSPVRTAYLYRSHGSHTGDCSLNDGSVIHERDGKAARLVSKTETKPNDPISIPSDNSDNMPDKSSPKDLAPGLLFASTSASNRAPAPFQQPKLGIRSPATMSGAPRLPKAFEDIRRKALIQTPPTNRVAQSMRQPKSPIGRSSPKFNTPKVSQEQSPKHPISYQSPHTPEAQALDRKRPRNQADAVGITPSFTRDTRKYGIIPARPPSEASNVSKKRAARSREHTRTQRRQAGLVMKESKTRREQLIHSWNDFFNYEAKRNSNWEEKMNDMVEQLAERDGRVAEHLAKIRKQERIISALESERQEYYSLQKQQELAFNESEARRQRMRERMKEYKDRLNDATNEQQKIFKYFQPRYHEMREQMKQAVCDNQTSLEEALSANNQVRDKIQKSVEEVRAISHQEIQKLRSEVNTLEVKLAEREKDVDRGKDHIEDLRRELDKSHELHKCSLASLNTQNKQLMDKSDERAIQIQDVGNCVAQQEQQIQSLCKFLEDDKATRLIETDLVKKLSALQKQTLDGILSELRESTSFDRKESSRVTEDLKMEILGIHQCLTSLSEKVQSNQSASEWQERFGKTQMEHQNVLRETDRLKEELAKMQDEAKTYREQQESLQEELTLLRARDQASDEDKRTIENLTIEKQGIQEFLDKQELSIQGLVDELTGANEILNAQDYQLKDQERQFQAEREKLTKTIASCQEQQEQVLKQAREECTRVQVEYHNIENRLHTTEQDNNRLQTEMVQIQQRADTTLKNSKDEAEKQAQEILQPIVNLMDNVLSGLETTEEARKGLNAKLDAWSIDQADLSLLRQVVQKLTEDQKQTIENGKLLEELLDVQKKMDATWEWHRSQFDALRPTAAEINKTSRHGHKLKQENEISYVAGRRVMIQSPSINKDDGDGGDAKPDEEKRTPISIEEERMTRRHTIPLKGILKPVVLETEARPEEEYYEPTLATTKQSKVSSKQGLERSHEKSTLVSHSAYNRPVLGSFSQLKGSVHESLPPSKETASGEMTVPKKRKRTETRTEQRKTTVKKIPQSAKKPLSKISESMSSDLHGEFHSTNSQEPTINTVQVQTQLWHSRGGPIKDRARPFVTYGSTTEARRSDSCPAILLAD
ncbi:hypothetical protein F5Y03DRAFT_403252 [Xylaria venustula]|nr:hypothetical protein F5Y03DRAFT_403252 [Xylaria venustula]